MTNTLPPITSKQQEILNLLYKYRFINRTQIQTLLNHKDKRRIITWLKDLREKEYIDWHYDSTNFIAKSQPAIYYLSLNGIRYLRELNIYPSEELRKRYKEPTRTKVFIDRCLLIADCCIALEAKNDSGLHYNYTLPTGYSNPTSKYYFLTDLKPHLFFSKRQGNVTTNYMLENFELTLPRYQVNRRIKDYASYLAYEWGDDNGPLPIALLICATTAGLIYVKRSIRKLIGDIDEQTLKIRVTTLDKIRISGITDMIWEEV